MVEFLLWQTLLRPTGDGWWWYLSSLIQLFNNNIWSNHWRSPGARCCAAALLHFNFLWKPYFISSISSLIKLKNWRRYPNRWHVILNEWMLLQQKQTTSNSQSSAASASAHTPSSVLQSEQKSLILPATHDVVLVDYMTAWADCQSSKQLPVLCFRSLWTSNQFQIAE